MSRIKFANLARQDLEEIFDYIAKDNEAAAEHFVEKLETRCRSLVDMPNVGRKRDDLATGLRSVTEGNYLIFYCVHGSEQDIYVVRVLHTKRDIDESFL